MRTELYINSQKATLDDDVSFPITFELADIRDPAARGSSYSKTIVLPGSKENNKIFKHIFEINVDNVFNPNRRSEAIVLCDGIEIFNGFLQLIQVNKIQYDEIQYECLLIGAARNLFSDMGNKYIRGNDDSDDDLDFYVYDHTLNSTNIVNSWSADYTNGFIYPLIDYGLSSGIVDPLQPAVDIKELFPAVYVRIYLDSIFNKHGYKYRSNFLDSDLVKKLIIPYSGGKPVEIGATDPFNDLDQQTTRVQPSPSQVISTSGTVTTKILYNDDSTPPNTDSGLHFNTSTSQWISPISKIWRFKQQFNFKVRSSSNSIGTLSVNLIIRNVTTSANLLTIPAWTVSTNVNTNHSITGGWESDLKSALTSGAVIVKAGDVIELRVQVNGTAFPGFTGIEIDSSSYATIEPETLGLGTGDVVRINNCVPAKLKQSDILIGLIKMFNLYIEVDKDDPTVYLIEPRDDYYSSGTPVNWSPKHDNSQQVEVLPMADLDWKNLKLAYLEDTDYLNTQYKNLTRQNYGEETVIMQNDFITEEKDITLPFAPTVLQNYFAVTSTILSTPVMPGIYQVSSNGVRSMFNAKPRILYYGGLKTGVFNLVQDSVVVAAPSTYPFAGNVDDPYDSTLDILFGELEALFYNHYGPITLTNNNLYNRYYSRMIEEVVNVNAKMVRAYFNLTPTDIQNFSFRNRVFWRDAYYYVNKIIDYDPNSDAPTQVELLYISEDFAQFVPDSTTRYGQFDITD